MFGEDPERYDRARPSYPADLIDDIVELVGAEARVVDVGCGTGKGTRLLAARGMHGVGVEADPAMAAVASEHLAPYPGWRIDVSDFEAWTPADRDAPADLVCAAQAWHWVDPRAGLRKAHELLRPGGWLAVWWNLADDDPSALRHDIETVYAKRAPGEPFCPGLDRVTLSPFDPRPNDPDYDPAFVAPSFGVPMMRLYRWQLTYTTGELLDLLRTHSNHRLMEPDRLKRLLDAVAAVVDRHGGTYDYPYVTRLWAAPRT